MAENYSVIVLESRLFQLEQRHSGLIDKAIGFLLKYKPSAEGSNIDQELSNDLQFCLEAKESVSQRPTVV